MNNIFLQKKELLDDVLTMFTSSNVDSKNPLFDAINHSISAPGKRIRGVLTLLFCEKLGVSDEQAVPFAVALELIHAYSLVHDDMPEMDNDDFRRGIPTCHKKYGSATALLAGDAILNLSIEFLLARKKLYQPDRFINALDCLFTAAGHNGMLGGQAIDKASENRMISLDELLELHRKKTGALLLAPIKIAEALSGTENENYVNYSKHIGLAFQIRDDILDVRGSKEELGKSIGKDREENKSTFVTLLGLDAADEYLSRELASAKSLVNDPVLLWLAEYIGIRNK
ncbi:MAG: polyprenyl synthetase family protein [Clostridia bacterium]|nr:polyprenyl synthetase family protein [Clostridia bacterium]